MRILIVDDMEETSEVLKDMLAHTGHIVDLALNGREALEFLKLHSYDLIFSDHDMPEMTGLELIKQIKMSGLKSITVMMSGYPNMKEFFIKTLGADEFISKPFTIQDILDVVKKYNGGQSL